MMPKFASGMVSGAGRWMGPARRKGESLGILMRVARGPPGGCVMEYRCQPASTLARNSATLTTPEAPACGTADMDSNHVTGRGLVCWADAVVFTARSKESRIRMPLSIMEHLRLTIRRRAAGPRGRRTGSANPPWSTRPVGSLDAFDPLDFQRPFPRLMSNTRGLEIGTDTPSSQQAAQRTFLLRPHRLRTHVRRQRGRFATVSVGAGPVHWRLLPDRGRWSSLQPRTNADSQCSGTWHRGSRQRWSLRSRCLRRCS